MEWVRKLRGSIVGLDTAPLIYFLESQPYYLSFVRPFFQSVARGDIQVVTSTLTLTEVLVVPYRLGNLSLAQQYSRILLNSRNLQTIPVISEIAADAAQIRAKFGVKTPDSIQLAIAHFGQATAFLRNDGKLSRIPGFQVIVLTGLQATP